MWAGFVFPFCLGVGMFNWLGCMVACLRGLALVVYHMPGVWACLCFILYRVDAPL